MLSQIFSLIIMVYHVFVFFFMEKPHQALCPQIDFSLMSELNLNPTTTEKSFHKNAKCKNSIKKMQFFYQCHTGYKMQVPHKDSTIPPPLLTLLSAPSLLILANICIFFASILKNRILPFSSVQYYFGLLYLYSAHCPLLTTRR